MIGNHIARGYVECLLLFVRRVCSSPDAIDVPKLYNALARHQEWTTITNIFKVLLRFLGRRHPQIVCMCRTL